MTQKLLLLPKTVVFAARVNMATITYPLSEVTFDGVTTGAFGDVKVGMTILFGSTAGNDDLGRKRIRAAADSTTLYIGRGSRGKHDGELNISDNSHITVIDTRSVWSKIPDINSNGDAVKDEEVYTDQNENIPPKAIISGGWRAATINSGTSLATFQFVGTASYGNGGATISSYLWDVGSGTITVGTSASNTITATFAAGSHWVKLTVTDSNANTHFMEVLVYADDPADSDCVAFECTNHTATAAGQQCSFRILEDIPISTYPDGMPVIFWEGEPSSTSDSSNVLFWGWHQTDSNTITADRTATLKDTTLFCLDVGGRLDTLPGFPQSVTRKASPTTWLEMAGLNMDLYIDYLFRWHSNAFELASFTPTGTGSALSITVIASAGQSLWDQVSKMAGALVPDYVLTCNRSGEIKAIVNPILQDTGDRTAVNQDTITDADFVSASWERRRPPRFHWNWAEALQSYTSGDPVPLFCVAPGFAPGQGESEANTTEQLAQSQDDLNACEGHRYAYMNAFHGQLALGLLTDSGIEPADMTWVTVTIDSSYHRRQLGFSAARGLPVEVNITYNYEPTGTTKTVEVLWEEETSGTPATTYEQPEIDWDFEIPDPTEIPTTPPTIGTGFGTVYIATNNVLGRTRAFSAASPTYSNISPSGTYTFQDFILDPHNPSDRALHLSTAGVNISDTMANVSPSWAVALSAASILTGTSGSTINGLYKIVGSINSEDYFGLLAHVDTTFWYIYTENGASSWNYVSITTQASGYSTLDIVPHVVGGSLMLYAYLHKNNDSYIFRSVDKGATWSQRQQFGAGASDNAVLIHCPYNNNSDGSLLYYSRLETTNGFLFKSTNGGTSHSIIDIGGVNDSTQIKRSGIETFTENNQRLYWWRAGNDGLYISTDGASNWSAAAASGISGAPTAAGGFPNNGQQYYLVTTAGIFVTVNGGSTFVNKTGDWAFGFTTAGSDVYTDIIVPDWTE